ncbi:MAG: hypothetical protein ACTSUV_07000 [Candidatus Ranarchaeia archaeon]
MLIRILDQDSSVEIGGFKKIINKISTILPESMRGKLEDSLSKLLEINRRTPSLALIQIMKFHHRIRQDKDISTTSILYNLLLCSKFYLHINDLGRLTITLVDLSDHLFSSNYSQEAFETIKLVFITLNKLDSKPWIRELIATVLLLVISAMIPINSMKEIKEIYSSFILETSKPQIDRIRREDVHKILRSFMKTKQKKDQIFINSLRKKQTKKGTIQKGKRDQENLTLFDLLEDLFQTYRIINKAYMFLKSI